VRHVPKRQPPASGQNRRAPEGLGKAAGRSVNELGSISIEEWLRQNEFAEIEFRSFGGERQACPEEIDQAISDNCSMTDQELKRLLPQLHLLETEPRRGPGTAHFRPCETGMLKKLLMSQAAIPRAPNSPRMPERRLS